MGEVIRFFSKAERERALLIREARAIYDSVFPPADPVGDAPANHGAAPIATMWCSRHDQDHRRALQPLLSRKLPRADRHHVGLRRRLNAVLPDGRAAARRVDAATPGRTPGGMALRHRQTGSQGSLGLPRRELAITFTRPHRN